MFGSKSARMWVTIVAALSLTVVACGSDDDSDSAGTASTGAAATVAPTVGGTEAPAATDAPAATEAPGATDGTAPAATTGGAAAEDGDAVQGGTLIFAHNNDVLKWDPAVFPVSYGRGGGGSGLRAAAVYDLLAYESPDGGEVVMRMAESLESDDAINWTLKLHPGIMFSDGTPYDAEAVKFGWERLADPATQSPQLTAASNIASLTVVDDVTLDIVLKEPTGQFRRIVANSLSALPSPTATQNGDTSIGAGPFIVDSFVQGSQTVLTRNPTYWDAPRPYLDGMVINIVPDENQRGSTMIAGDADVTYTPDAVSAKRMVDAGLSQTVSTPNGGRPIVFNNATAPFDNPLARMAMAKALDCPSYVETVEGGEGQVATSIFGPESPFYTADNELPQFDAAEAQTLLDQYAEETGGPLSFTLTFSESVRTSGEFWQAQLSQFDNLDVQLQLIAITEVTPSLQRGDYQAMGYANSWIDPEPLLYNFVHSGGSINWMKYSNPSVDAGLEAGRATLDEDERVAAYADVQAGIAEDVPFVYCTRFSQFNVYNDNVHGMDKAVFGDGAVHPVFLWLDES